MRRPVLFVAVALTVAAVALVPIGALATGDGLATQQTTESADNETDAVAPGERLSGVVGVGQSELENEVDSRAFGLEIARAASDDAKADVLKERFDDVQQRVEAVEQRKAELQQARENGSLSEGAYRARMAMVAAELEGAKRIANQSERVAEGLPAEALAEKGIDVDAIRTLRDKASELGGQEVAEIARSIAGPSVGKVPDHAGPPEGRAPPDRTEEPSGDDNETRGPPTDTTDRADGNPGSQGNGTAPEGPLETSDRETATETESDQPTDTDDPRGGGRA